MGQRPGTRVDSGRVNSCVLRCWLAAVHALFFTSTTPGQFAVRMLGASSAIFYRLRLLAS
eukprot:856406-Prymnesium_polylepis.1